MNMREEFEEWFKEKFEVPDFVFSDFDESAGEYNYTEETEELYIKITMMFEAWQDAQPKWIKCSEQMPKPGIPVLIVGCDAGPVEFSAYEWDGNVWQDYLGDYGEIDRDSITHWMPLPNPPEE